MRKTPPEIQDPHRITINRVVAAYALAMLIPTCHATSADEYIELNPQISSKCGITFSHPKHWRIYIIESNNSDEQCTILYGDEGQREGAGGKFVIKKQPTGDRLNEFGFGVTKNGKVTFIGEDYSLLKGPGAGHSRNTFHDFKFIKQGGGILYIAHGGYTWIDENNRKSKVKDVSLLFGDETISIGYNDSEFESAPSTLGTVATYEKIFKSMKLTTIANSSH